MKDFEIDQIRNLIRNYKSFDEFYNSVLKFLNIKNIEAIKEFYKYSTINEESWKAYKYFKSEETINMYDKTYIDIDTIINEIKGLDLSDFKRIIVRLNNKTYKDINKLKLFDIDFYFIVNGDKGLCTIDEFINMRDFFDFFRNEYNSYNLSQLEKVTLCYDYVKFFLYNEEENNNKTESRSIPKSLKTGNIVCEGYSKIFCQLLAELGIESNLMYLLQSNKDDEKHVRPIVYIKDEKYGLDDHFIFDPTWDSYKAINDSKYSTIKYDYFLINVSDYSLYFYNEIIDRIVDYKTEQKKDIKLGNNYKDNVYFKMSKDMFDYLIIKIKTIEGYSLDQINEYLCDIKKLRLK